MEGQVKVLLEAEKAAQEIMKKARADRDQIMRSADEAAKMEIEEYKAKSNQKLQKLQDEVDAEIAAATEKMEKETNEDLKRFQSNLDDKLDEVADLLVNATIRVC